MTLNSRMQIRDVLRRYPHFEELLGWLDIILEDEDYDSTLEQLCDDYEVDIDEIIGNLLDGEGEDGESWVDPDEEDEDESSEDGSIDEDSEDEDSEDEDDEYIEDEYIEYDEDYAEYEEGDDEDA